MNRVLFTVALLASAAATSANAATTTYTGNPTGNSGNFGTAAAAQGATVFTNATFDAPTVGATITSSSSVSQQTGVGPGQGNTTFTPLSGGEGQHASSAYLQISGDGSVTINFLTSVFGGGLSTIDLFNPGGVNPVTLSAYTGLNGTGTLLGTATAAGFNFQANNTYFLGILSDTANVNSLVFTSFGSTTGDVVGVDNIVSARATVGGAVPEPRSWALMIVGFGLAGYAMRRRSHTRTTVRFA